MASLYAVPANLSISEMASSKAALASGSNINQTFVKHESNVFHIFHIIFVLYQNNPITSQLFNNPIASQLFHGSPHEAYEMKQRRGEKDAVVSYATGTKESENVKDLFDGNFLFLSDFKAANRDIQREAQSDRVCLIQLLRLHSELQLVIRNRLNRLGLSLGLVIGLQRTLLVALLSFPL